MPAVFAPVKRRGIQARDVEELTQLKYFVRLTGYFSHRRRHYPPLRYAKVITTKTDANQILIKILIKIYSCACRYFWKLVQ